MQVQTFNNLQSYVDSITGDVGKSAVVIQFLFDDLLLDGLDDQHTILWNGKLIGEEFHWDEDDYPNTFSAYPIEGVKIKHHSGFNIYVVVDYFGVRHCDDNYTNTLRIKKQNK